jgi:putative endonuclease
MTGSVSYHAGLAAEEAVLRHYERSGRTIAAQRWRGLSGEIDLVMREGDCVIFIEVKQSATHAEAAIRLSDRQMARIYGAAAEFLEGEHAGQLTQCRFDVALVDGMGRIEVLENAFGG